MTEIFKILIDDGSIKRMSRWWVGDRSLELCVCRYLNGLELRTRA